MQEFDKGPQRAPRQAVEGSAFDDPAPGVRIGDFVQFKVRIEDEGEVITEAGDFGWVIGKEVCSVLSACLPTVRVERTGRLYDVTTEEIEVLAEAGFAAEPETTPRKPRRTPLRRGFV